MRRRQIASEIKWLLAIGILFSIEACSGSDMARWTEEVKSWDGTVFKLEGRAEIGASGWPNAHRGTRTYTEYYDRNTGAYWKSPKTYNPYIFDLVDGVPIVVVRSNDTFRCRLFDYPQKSILIYRWNTTNGWQEVSPEDLPVGLEFNLLLQIFDTRDKKNDVRGFVSLEEKIKREGARVGEFADWLKKYGDFCDKARKNPPGYTDQSRPELSGFHGEPNF